MAFQTSRQVSVAFATQATIGVKPAANSAMGFRFNSGSLNLTKEPIQSGENRRDGQTTLGRHGSRSVSGNFVGDLSVKAFDPLIERFFWSTFSPLLTVDDATVAMDSATLSVGAHTIVASAGSWIDSGLRVGDVIRVTAGLAAGNLNRNLRILGLTDTTITVAETLTVQAGPIATYTLVRPKKVVPGEDRELALAFEERQYDIGGSKYSDWCRISSFILEMQPNGMATVNFQILGTDQEVLEGVDSPYFIDPVYTVRTGLTAVEAKIYLGTEIVDLSSLSLTFDRRASAFPVSGSNISPDIFDNNIVITGSITGLRQNFERTKQFINEELMSLHLLFAENTAEPAEFISVVIPMLTLATSTESEAGQDGPMTQSFDLLIGADNRGGAYDPVMVIWQTSAA